MKNNATIDIRYTLQFLGTFNVPIIVEFLLFDKTNVLIVYSNTIKPYLFYGTVIFVNPQFISRHSNNRRYSIVCICTHKLKRDHSGWR